MATGLTKGIGYQLSGGWPQVLSSIFVAVLGIVIIAASLKSEMVNVVVKQVAAAAS